MDAAAAARERILNTATELFYREGVNATGVERLASKASVSKRTLYQHFPSKTAVVEEYLRCIQQRVEDPIRPGPDAANRAPRERILALFETPSLGWQMRGCPFHNAAVEAAELCRRFKKGAVRRRSAARTRCSPN